MQKKVLGGVLGLCTGDALGVPFEFVERGEIKKNPVTGITGCGTYNQPPGTWSDDSSLTLCLLDSLCSGYDLKDISLKFLKWYETGYWTAHGKVFDIGGATRKAMIRLKKGIGPGQAGGKTEFDNGNGSLMRILPLVFLLKNERNIKDKARIVYEVSAITHAHPRSQMACLFYVETGINIIKGCMPKDAYTKAKEDFKAYYDNSACSSELNHFSRIINEDVSGIQENGIYSSGYVIHTLEAAIWCLINSATYKETVLKAVNLGDDTDTTAAVAGGLAGLYYGIDGIPPEWLNVLAKKREISDLCIQFCKKYV